MYITDVTVRGHATERRLLTSGPGCWCTWRGQLTTDTPTGVEAGGGRWRRVVLRLIAVAIAGADLPAFLPTRSVPKKKGWNINIERDGGRRRLVLKLSAVYIAGANIPRHVHKNG